MSLIRKIKNWKCTLPILIMLGVGVLCVMYFVVLRIACRKKAFQYCDILNFRIFPWGKECCSAWPLSHFVMFMILGFFFPDCWLTLFIMGLLWEGWEFISGTFQKKHYVKNDGKMQYTEKWWQANIYDIFFNGAGILVGYVARKLFWKKKCKPCNPASPKVPDKPVRTLSAEEIERARRDRAAVEAMASWG